MPCTRMESGISSGIPGMPAGGIGIPSGGAGIPAGGAGMLFFGYANRRIVAISMGAPSVFETMVPDRVCCAINGITTTQLSIISKYFIALTLFGLALAGFRYMCLLVQKLCQKSISTSAAMASTTATARTATHASCLPFWDTLLPSRLMASNVFLFDAVGLNTQRKTIGVPSLIPPAIPPDMSC